MAKQTSLQEQTSDPRWQRKRLEILERDKWTCKQCGDTETTLTVHHKSYRMEGGKFVDYWDYENSELITLCNPCHEHEEDCLNDLKKNMFYSLRDVFENASDISSLASRLSNMKKDQGRLKADDFYITSAWVSSKKNKSDFIKRLEKVITVRP